MTVKDFLSVVPAEYSVTVCIGDRDKPALILNLPVANGNAEYLLDHLHEDYFNKVNRTYARNPYSKKLRDAIRELTGIKPANILDRDVKQVSGDILERDAFLIKIDGPELRIPYEELMTD